MAPDGTEPELWSRIVGFVSEDAAHGLFDLWGRSTVVDEYVGGPVIGQSLFDMLHSAAALTAQFPVGNAGLLHVYGYWLSTVETPFGLKRDRWLDGRLARALGVSPDWFHLERKAGATPLARVTASALPLLRRPPVADDSAETSLTDNGPRSRVVLHRAQGSPTTALLYGYEVNATMQLVTVFPYRGERRALLDDFRWHPRPRWNAAPSI